MTFGLRQKLGQCAMPGTHKKTRRVPSSIIGCFDILFINLLIQPLKDHFWDG